LRVAGQPEPSIHFWLQARLRIPASQQPIGKIDLIRWALPRGRFLGEDFFQEIVHRRRDRIPRTLSHSKGIQSQDGHAASKAFGHPPHEAKPLRPGDQPGSGPAILVHPIFDIGEEARHILDFVKDHRWGVLIQKRHRIGFGPESNVRALEGGVPVGVTELVAQEGRFACLACAGNQDDREGGGRTIHGVG
jgi:hypothetical protein